MLKQVKYDCRLCGARCVSFRMLKGTARGKPFTKKTISCRAPTTCARCRFAASAVRMEGKLKPKPSS